MGFDLDLDLISLNEMREEMSRITEPFVMEFPDGEREWWMEAISGFTCDMPRVESVTFAQVVVPSNDIPDEYFKFAGLYQKIDIDLDGERFILASFPKHVGEEVAAVWTRHPEHLNHLRVFAAIARAEFRVNYRYV